MVTVLAWVPPEAEPETKAHMLVDLGMGPKGAGVWKMGVAWEPGKPIPGCRIEPTTTLGHCSLHPIGSSLQSVSQDPGKKGGRIHPWTAF